MKERLQHNIRAHHPGIEIACRLAGREAEPCRIYIVGTFFKGYYRDPLSPPNCGEPQGNKRFSAVAACTCQHEARYMYTFHKAYSVPLERICLWETLMKMSRGVIIPNPGKFGPFGLEGD